MPVFLFRRLIFLVFLQSVFLSMVWAQNISERKYSVNCSDKKCTDLLEQLMKEYPVEFIYKPQWFDGYRLSLMLSDVSLDVMMGKIFMNKPYSWKVIQNRYIVLLPKEELALLTGDMTDFTRGTFSSGMRIIGDPSETGKYARVNLQGKITHGKTGEAILGASVQVENLPAGTVSGLDGSFNLELKPGLYNLMVSSIGYEMIKVPIRLVSHGSLDIELFEKSVKLDEITIYAQRADQNVRGNQMSLVELDAKGIRLMPSSGGEKDVLKNLTMIPGIKSIGEFGSGINVRGGGEDQNLILLQTAPLFNTSHVFGLLSVVNPDAVNSLSLYKGHIPADMGERVSSVMDIRVTDNTSKKLQSKGGIGLYNSRLLLRGPLGKKLGSFMIGGRSSYSDWLLKKMNDPYLSNSSAFFYDANASLNFILKNNRLTLFAYQSFDDFAYSSQLAYNYGNQLASLEWNYRFSDQLNSVLSASLSRYNVNKEQLDLEYEKKKIRTALNYTQLKYMLSWTPGTKARLDAGTQAIHYIVFPGDQIPINTESLAKNIRLPEERATEISGFANARIEFTESVTLTAGLRYTAYSLWGEKDLRLYNSTKSRSEISIEDTIHYQKGDLVKAYAGLEPRISVKYQFSPFYSVKLSYNRNKQYLTLVSVTAVPTPDDYWKLADPYVKPLQCDQFALGFYRNSSNHLWEFSVEGYYKRLQNILEYKNDASFEMNFHPETELTGADGFNYGIEFLLKKSQGQLEGWLGYTWSRSLRKTEAKFREDQVNSNQLYPSSFDKPHDLNLVATWHANRRWRFTGTFNFSSGRPATIPEYQFPMAGNIIVFYSDRNKYRLPPYHRLDLAVSLDESLRLKKKWKGSWTFSILNVYARKNAYSVFYKKETPDITNDYRYFALYQMYLIGKAFPTLTYNFIF